MKALIACLSISSLIAAVAYAADPAASSLVAKGIELSSRNRFDEAVGYFTRVVRHGPNNQKALAERGDCYYRMGRYADAIKDLDRAIELDPADGWSYNIRYHAYIELRDYRKALVDCHKGLNLMSGYRSGQTDFALLCGKLRNDSEGEKIIARLRKEDPVVAVRLLMSELRYKEAIEAASKLLKKPLPMIVRDNALDLRASCYTKLGDHRKALADYNEMIQINPKPRPRKIIERAELEVALQKYSDAAKDYTWLINKPGYRHEAIRMTIEDFFYRRADCYFKGGEFRKAIAEYDSILKRDPTHEEAYKYRGDCHAAVGENELAIADYTKAIENDNESPGSSYFARSLVYEKMGNKVQAAGDKKRAMDLGYVPKVEKGKH